MRVAMLLFPDLTQLDLTGPHEVLARMPGARIELVAANRAPVVSETKLAIVPTATFDDIAEAELLFVPGGRGQIAATRDEATLAWLRRVAAKARFVTSACTGALLLGAAGLLRGYRATTHWAYLDLLPLVGAEPVDDRVVIDRNRITAAGVTAGIDGALAIAAEVCGSDLAARIALNLEYDPKPAFPGHPRSASPELVAETRELLHARHAERAALLRRSD
jgi:cyclohexyl-isocyanide hydratase